MGRDIAKSSRQMLRRISLILVSSAIVLAIAVLITIANLSAITQSSVNRYLASYNSELTQLTITPSSIVNGRIPALSVRVNDSLIDIKDLQFTFAKEVSWFGLSISDIASISVGQIDVTLSANFFTGSNSKSNSGPSSALNLDALPRIAVGNTHLHLKQRTDDSISLDLDYLNLDNQGRLTSAISHQGNKLFKLNALLGKTHWTADTYLSFDVLTRLIDQLPRLHNDKEITFGPLASLISMQKSLDKHHISLKGELRSTIDLDIALAYLTSTHQLEQLTVSLDKIEQVVLPTPIDITPQTDLGNHADFQKRVFFDVSGPLSQLTLTLQPMQVSLPISAAQQKALSKLLGKNLSGAINMSRAQTAQQTEILLQLVDPLTYELNSQKLSLNQLRASATIGDNKISGRLDDLSLINTDGLHRLHTDWQVSLAHKTRVCISLDSFDLKLNVNHDSTPPDNQNNQITTNCTKTPPHNVTISALNLLLQGRLNINELPLASAETANAKTAPQTYQGELTIAPASEFSMSQPYYITPTVAVKADRISAKLLQPLTLKFNEHLINKNANRMSLTFGEIAVNVAGNQLKFGGSDDNPPYSLTSHNSELLASGGEIALDNNKLSKITLLPLSLKTINPVLITSKLTATTSEQPVNTQSSMTQPQHTQLSNTQISSAQVELQNLGKLNLKVNTNSNQDSVNLPAFRANISETTLTRNGVDDNHQPLVTIINVEKLSLTTGAMSGTVSLETNKNASISPSLAALINQDWHTHLDYRLANLSAKERYYRLGKQRQRTHLILNNFSLNQSLNWNADKQASYLTTKEQWQLDNLAISSSHRFALPKANQSQAKPSNVQENNLMPSKMTTPTLDGELKFNSDANQLIDQLERWLKVTVPASVIGDVGLDAHYRLLWQEEAVKLAGTITPQLVISEGEVNALPFKQATIGGKCDVSANVVNNSYQSQLYCDPLKLNIRAFNPGIVITDIDAIAKIDINDELSTDQLTTMRLNRSQENADVGKKADIDVTAKANTLGGRVLLPKFNLNLNAPSDAYLVLQGLDLEQLLAVQPQVGIYADGIFDGVLPVELAQGQVSVKDGRLAARAPGGLIKVDDNPAVMQMRLSQPYLDFAFSALEELHYTELSSRLDMAPNGDALLKVNVKGRAKDIERPIHLNYTQEENLLQLLKSLQIGDSLQREIEKTMEQ
ncbi:YdbH domain-containing protein [Shewanella mesophila]|uniref:YdbH domain-containing protein n=1 Tax=Shewanella mesophila TaxID=2864208 RepID=UPI001C65C0E7|nr:YdbH domain-containing protein [Shewanella mesophila]QYJ84676.1 YdbH domain-containing protein [Shewanella mesophila]